MPKNTNNVDLLSVEELNENDKSSNKAADEKRRIPFAVVEAYKRIRTNLTFLLAQNDENHAIVITSANASEGKSTTCANLGVAFSQLEKRVLIIDADMRRASLHKKFKLQNTVGLSNVLSGMVSFEEAVMQVNKNLYFVTAGDIPPNPSELLGSKRFLDLLDYVNEHYDLIIIDSPPLNVVSDALVIAPNTAGAILIVHDGFTPHYSIKKAMDAIQFANAKLLGVIMNGANSYLKGKYTYRRYKYSKNYSYGYEYRRHSSTK